MADLTGLLRSELELVERFVETLRFEQDALKAGQADALPDLGEQKSRLVDALNETTGERNALLQQAGFTPDRDGMRRWLVQHRTDQEAMSLWTRLLKKAAEAQELNRVNGLLIAMHLQKTSDALEILTQKSRQASLYDRGGLTTGFTGSRIIDTA